MVDKNKAVGELWDSLSQLRSSMCERRLERAVLRPALLPVKTAQFAQLLRQVWMTSHSKISQFNWECIAPFILDVETAQKTRDKTDPPPPFPLLKQCRRSFQMRSRKSNKDITVVSLEWIWKRSVYNGRLPRGKVIFIQRIGIIYVKHNVLKCGYMFRPSVIIRPCYIARQKIPCTYWDPIMFTMTTRLLLARRLIKKKN
jgi:hypothetical protein